MTTPDADLISALLADLDRGFADVVRAHQRTVYNTALRVSSDVHDADDLTSECFLRAYHALTGYEPERIIEIQLRPWLLTILLNLWRNHVRTLSRRPREISADERTEGTASDRDGEQHVVRAEARQKLRVLLAELPSIQRWAVVLRHVLDLPISEVATVLRCPEGTAKSHVSRGLAALRKQSGRLG